MKHLPAYDRRERELCRTANSLRAENRRLEEALAAMKAENERLRDLLQQALPFALISDAGHADRVIRAIEAALAPSPPETEQHPWEAIAVWPRGTKA